MRLYLAHPTDMRKEIREWEIEFEKETGIELLNPFYDEKGEDPEYEMIKQVDSGEIDPEMLNRYPDKEFAMKIVQSDLDKISNCDALVAFIEPDMESFGTPMELFWSSYCLDKKTYVIIKKMAGHPWILGMATKIFKDKESFTEWIKNRNIYKL